MKKLICILCLAFLLASCGTTVEDTSAGSADSQLKLLMSCMDIWKQSDELYGEHYFYSVTDLDWNGRLEIIAAVTQGTGHFTYGAIYEVSEDYQTVNACKLALDDGETLPEIIMNFVPAAYNKENHQYYYLFKDDTRIGPAEYVQAVIPLYLQSGEIICEPIARMYLCSMEGNAKEEYFLGDNVITAAQYEGVVKEFQAQYEGFTANFEWFTFEEPVERAVLQKSWEFFRASLD